MKRVLACIGLVIACLALVILIACSCYGCTPGQRSHCCVCEATGFCHLMGDDPNIVGRPKYPFWDSRGWGDGNNH